MAGTAINVEGLGKKYIIGKKRSGEFRETFSHFLKKIAFRSNNNQAPSEKDFWALKDISFEVKRGEAIGIIGRNGAGKSTLLKVLSRITKPSTGRFEIHGRVSSLLEVGTGFHPELTGRENVYLNGTVLGMRRAEIKAKFDEIVAFSGVEDFIDTPVKHYSSGMKVRLAFSVAAHLEAEILFIDEVLAVGDAEFQKKCLGKMEDVTGQGRTVLFVSHNMDAVRKLCGRLIYLSVGIFVGEGEPDQMIARYLSDSEKTDLQEDGTLVIDNGIENNRISIDKIELLCEGARTFNFYPGALFRLNISYSQKQFAGDLKVGFIVRDDMDKPLIGINNQNVDKDLFKSNSDKGQISIMIPSLPLVKSGKYYIDLYFGNHEEDFLILEKQVQFFIDQIDVYDTGHLPNNRINTIFCPEITFNHISK